MDGLTIDEMCEKLKLPFKTVEARIQRAGIKPLTKQALYPYKTLDIIKDVTMGRPKKAAEPEPARPKAKKPAKPKK
jgi:hypothetical protein